MNTIKKVHIQLTLLNGCITTLILVIMTLGYLFISESNMMQGRISSYPRDIYSIASYIEQQDIISSTWLSQLESNDRYYISLMDNGAEFLYNVNKEHVVDDRQQILRTAWELYHDDSVPKTMHTLSLKSSYASYVMDISSKYYCFVVTIEKNHATLEVLLAAPLKDLQEQITRQRVLFLGIITLALIAIWSFAWIFTGKLLDPIEANRLRQNQFIAAASHELRTPLAVILSCAEAGLTRGGSPELSTIKNESLRTSRLLGDMLTLLSCDTGHLDIKPAATQLDTLVLNACETFENVAWPRFPRISFLTVCATANGSRRCSPSSCTTPSAIHHKAVRSAFLLHMRRDAQRRHIGVRAGRVFRPTGTLRSASLTQASESATRKKQRSLTAFTAVKKPEAIKITSGWVCL